jgi:hypothetical protein
MKKPSKEQVRKRAYEIHLKHGKPGRDLQDWLQAERELTEISELGEIETAVWEDTSTRRGVDDTVTIRSNRTREFKKGF